MKPKRIILILLVLAVLAVWVIRSNTVLVCSHYTVASAELPQPFDGLCIAHISDLHNGDFNDALISALEERRPDLIAITGDLLDSRSPDLERVLDLSRRAAAIAPCYYVTGNHEGRLKETLYPLLEQGLTEAGVTVLHGAALAWSREGQTVTLAGVDDPRFSGEAISSASLSPLAGEGFTVLLSHRPEHFPDYVRAGFDLVLSGHAHGGQFRLPLLGGVLAPDQGFFPAYDAGIFQEGGTAMAVSRGIGSSAFPFRLNNPPELIFLTLQCAPSENPLSSLG